VQVFARLLLAYCHVSVFVDTIHFRVTHLSLSPQRVDITRRRIFQTGPIHFVVLVATAHLFVCPIVKILFLSVFFIRLVSLGLIYFLI